MLSSPLAETLPFISRPDGQTREVSRDGDILVVRAPSATANSRWSMREQAGALSLNWLGPQGSQPDPLDVLAAIETALSCHPDQPGLALHIGGLHAPDLLQSGAVLQDADGLRVCRDLFWQQARLWRPAVQAPFALQYTLTQGRRHPRRPPKPTGVVYQRFIPWLGKTFSFRTLDMAQDLERFNRWMNDPVVAQFWQEEGDLAKHRQYLQAIADDPHMTSLIACFDGEPFAYFEVYWAKENRIGPFYDVDDHDRGWHVLVGEAAFRGKQFATAWLTSISHFLFLDDPRTQRVVGEPRADHAQQIRNLDKSGFAKIKEFDFPHKRALLISMLRERYFGERLWLPRSDAAPVSPSQPPVEKA